MGKSGGVIIFKDDTLAFTWYQNTSDIMHNVLTTDHNFWRTPEETKEYNEACHCKGEKVTVWTDYGGGFYWQGNACKKCMMLKEGVNPYTEEADIYSINGRFIKHIPRIKIYDGSPDIIKKMGW